jgi:hypothetical protein
MKLSLAISIIALLFAFQAAGQAKTRKLSTSINHPSINLYAPYISADANALLFVSDNAEDNALTPFFTLREAADWREPQPFPKNIYTRSNLLRGYSLSADGKRMYLTTMKSPGVGGFDIVYSDLKGTVWTDPVNLGMPVNSKGHDGCASVTADGNVIYFMRCEKMDPSSADNCKILRSVKKGNGQWGEPEELPAKINTGNSQAPRIMADGETLIFSSNKVQPSKGGMDLFLTRFNGTDWSNPAPLDFVNTEKDDQFVSVSGLGRYLLRDTPGSRKNELVEFLIPDQLRPKGMMKVEGKVLDPSSKPVPAYISAVDMKSGKRYYSGRPGPDGSFLLYLKEGTQYEFTVDPEQNHFTYFSRIFDLTSDKIPQIEKVNATIKPLAPGDEIKLDLVKFKSNSADLETSSMNELKRLARVINANGQSKFEIQVMLQGYVEDSVQSNLDLTETIIDSLTLQYQTLDSAGQTVMKDTVVVETTFHNDRTSKQAQTIITQLQGLGVKPENLSYFVNAIPAVSPEDRRLTVKAVVKK